MVRTMFMDHPPSHFHEWGPENPNQTDRLNQNFAGNDSDPKILDLTDSLSKLLQMAWFDGNEIEDYEITVCRQKNFVTGSNLKGDDTFHIVGHSVAPSQFGWIVVG